MNDGLHITFAQGKIRAYLPDGTEITGIKHASIELQQDGLSEVALYFGIKTGVLHDVHRASDGVRETRPEPDGVPASDGGRWVNGKHVPA